MSVWPGNMRYRKRIPSNSTISHDSQILQDLLVQPLRNNNASSLILKKKKKKKKTGTDTPRLSLFYFMRS